MFFFLFLQERGYTFPTTQWMFYGTITFVSADNLAANLLGGFKEGSTAYRGCRHYMATLSEMKTQVYTCNMNTSRCILNICTQMYTTVL